jgi:hypothetical protein
MLQPVATNAYLFPHELSSIKKVEQGKKKLGARGAGEDVRGGGVEQDRRCACWAVGEGVVRPGRGGGRGSSVGRRLDGLLLLLAKVELLLLSKSLPACDWYRCGHGAHGDGHGRSVRGREGRRGVEEDKTIDWIYLTFQNGVQYFVDFDLVPLPAPLLPSLLPGLLLLEGLSQSCRHHPRPRLFRSCPTTCVPAAHLPDLHLTAPLHSTETRGEVGTGSVRHSLQGGELDEWGDDSAQAGLSGAVVGFLGDATS